MFSAQAVSTGDDEAPNQNQALRGILCADSRAHCWAELLVTWLFFQADSRARHICVPDVGTSQAKPGVGLDR